MIIFPQNPKYNNIRKGSWPACPFCRMSAFNHPASSVFSPMAFLANALKQLLGKRPSGPASESAVTGQILVDQVWSCFSDEGAEYLCLRLQSPDAKPGSGILDVQSLPLDSSYRLLAAAKISVTLELNPHAVAGVSLSLKPQGVES